MRQRGGGALASATPIGGNPASMFQRGTRGGGAGGAG